MDHAGSNSAALAETANRLNDAATREQTVDAIVYAARWSVPGADYVGISTSDSYGRLQSTAITDPFVLELDMVQAEIGEGPCVYATHPEVITFIPDLAAETRWPAYIREANARGLRAQICVQLWADEDLQASLNVYSARAGALDQSSLHTADLFASQASVALCKAQTHDQLSDAMQSRQDIGAAVGMVMLRYELTREQAFAYLTRMSQNTNTKLRDVAIDILAAHEAGLVPSDAYIDA